MALHASLNLPFFSLKKCRGYPGSTIKFSRNQSIGRLITFLQRKTFGRLDVARLSSREPEGWVRIWIEIEIVRVNKGFLFPQRDPPHNYNIQHVCTASRTRRLAHSSFLQVSEHIRQYTKKNFWDFFRRIFQILPLAQIAQNILWVYLRNTNVSQQTHNPDSTRFPEMFSGHRDVLKTSLGCPVKTYVVWEVTVIYFKCHQLL